MRSCPPRRSFLSAAPVVVAIMSGAILAVAVFFGFASGAVGTETVPLSVGVDRSLSLVNQPIKLTIGGQASESLDGSQLVVTIKGPIAAAEVGARATESAAVVQVSRWLGTAPAGAGAEAETTTTVPPGSSTPSELRAGTLKASVTLRAGKPSAPGAYLVLVEVRSGGTVLASGQTWLGKAAVRQTPLDVAFVLPLSLGIHRDCWSGAFYDQVLERALVPVEAETETLRGLLPLVDRYPTWHLSVAVEPILLAQLRDMADGYTYAGADGSQIEVTENDLAAQNASVVLLELDDLAGRESVEILASPYAGADMALLAGEGWGDGFEQIQMGKQELQRALDLEAPPTGAYSPDLGLTSDSLADYAASSVEYVVVDAELRAFLEEEFDSSTVIVRAQNADRDRLTLVFAESGITAVMRPPWDVNMFGAAVAAELASSSRDALVIAPADLFELIPASYLDSVGAMLSDEAWIRTSTLQDLVGLHSPGSRPVLFATSSGEADGYIKKTVMERVRDAHAVVTDLGLASDTTLTPVDRAHRLLYTAESRWWARTGTTPQEASMGLAYADQARAVAEAEFSKVSLTGMSSPLATGAEGVVSLTVENDAGYPMSVALEFSGEDVEFLNGEHIPLDLLPGSTELSFGVASDGGSHNIVVSLVAGSTVLDERTHLVRFLGLMTVLPWVIVAAVLMVAGGAYVILRRRGRGRSETAGE